MEQFTLPDNVQPWIGEREWRKNSKPILSCTQWAKRRSGILRAWAIKEPHTTDVVRLEVQFKAGFLSLEWNVTGLSRDDTIWRSRGYVTKGFKSVLIPHVFQKRAKICVVRHIKMGCLCGDMRPKSQCRVIHFLYSRLLNAQPRHHASYIFVAYLVCRSIFILRGIDYLSLRLEISAY